MPELHLNTPVEYRPIPGFPGYRAGADGTIWSCLKKRGRLRATPTGEWKCLKQIASAFGYLRVSMCHEGHRHLCLVHRMVLLAFVGLPPAGTESCHFDGNPANNTLDNLRWDTKAKNGADTSLHGKLKGIKNPKVKLTEAQVIEIRQRVAAGEYQKVVAHNYGTTQANVNSIVLRKTWRHVT